MTLDLTSSDIVYGFLNVRVNIRNNVGLYARREVILWTGYTAPIIRNVRIGWSEWLDSRPGRFTTGERFPVLVD